MRSFLLRFANYLRSLVALQRTVTFFIHSTRLLASNCTELPKPPFLQNVNRLERRLERPKDSRTRFLFCKQRTLSRKKTGYGGTPSDNCEIIRRIRKLKRL